MEENRILETALDLIAEGFSVIPLAPRNKVPDAELLPKDADGNPTWAPYQNEVADEETVRRWFADGAHNLGVVTGSVSGNLVVMDFDSREAAETWGDTFKSVVAGAPLVRTGRDKGGWHLWLRSDTPIPTQKRNGWDIKGEGGYVVARPSIHPSGRAYTLVRGDLAKVPEIEAEILDLVPDHGGNGHEKEPGWQDELLEEVQEGRRHDSMVKLVGSWIRKKLSDKEILELAMAVNAKWDPPLPHVEVENIVTSLRKSDDRKHTPRHLVLTTIQEILEAPPIEWLIDNILFDRTFSILGGFTGFGKSLLSLAIAKSVVDGCPLFGKYPVQRRGTVLVVDQENSLSDLRERILKMGITRSAPLYFLSFQGILLDEKQHFEQLLSFAKDLDPVLVIFDSLVRFHRAHENDASEMALVMERFREFTNAGIGVLVQHHHNKGTGALELRSRGSSDIIGASDVEYSLYRNKDEHLVLQTVKSRRAPVAPLELDIIDRDGHLELECLGTALEQKQELRQLILSNLHEPKDIGTLRMLLENAGYPMGEKILRDHLRFLLALRQIRVSVGRYNHKEYIVA